MGGGKEKKNIYTVIRRGGLCFEFHDQSLGMNLWAFRLEAAGMDVFFSPRVCTGRTRMDLRVCEVRSSINVGRENDTANRLLGFGVSYRLCHKYYVKGRVNFVVTA